MIKQIEFEGMDAICLSNERVSLVFVPEVGGKIVSLRRSGGREWLWRNPFLPLVRPVYGSSFVELYDTGGWDECFPTVNPCAVFGVELPDHGELVTQAWRVEESGSDFLRLSVEGVRLPYRFERTISLVEDGFDVAYRVENLSDQDIPYIWCCHPLFAIEPGMVISVPGAPSGRLSFATNDFEPGEFVWPDLHGLDLSVVSALGVGLKSFVGPLDEGWVGLRTDHEELVFSFSQISHVAFWMNYGAWSGCGSEPYFNLGIEPCIGPFDSLVEAGASDPVVRGRETLEWSLKVAISAVE